MPAYRSAEKFVLSREFFGMKLGLENITEFLNEIGSPQDSYKTIHVAGTNGKGSTCAMLASILQEQGYKTGLFTSPHLISLRERIRVNDRIIPKASVTAFVNSYRKILTRRKLSFFELLTAMALYYFKKAKVDVAVIETGLGGRLDATNVLKPVLTITTEISRDHIEILGKTIPKITFEKAGIIKPGVPHLIGALPESAEKVIKKICDKRKSKLYRLKANKYFTRPDSISFLYNFESGKQEILKPGLVGPHQIQNAALVTRATELLNQNSLRISRRALKKGLALAHWDGRFQIIKRKNKSDLILDVGHNVSGVKAFVETFEKLYPERKAYLLTGFVKRKEHQKMFNLLSRIAAAYYLVPLNTHRSIDIDDLIAALDWKKIEIQRFKSIKRAYTKLLDSTTADDIIVVIGSHFLVGEFLDKIGTK